MQSSKLSVSPVKEFLNMREIIEVGFEEFQSSLEKAETIISFTMGAVIITLTESASDTRQSVFVDTGSRYGIVF